MLKTIIVRRLSIMPSICVGFFLSGCVVGPDYKTPVPLVPATWRASKADVTQGYPVLEDWWKTLKDPILDDLVARAVRQNLDVATAKAKIREARASTLQQVGGLLPTFSESSSATRNRGQSNSAEVTVYSQYQSGFDASWELDLFGGTKRAVEASFYAEQSSEAQLRDTLVTLIGDVATYYVQAREYQQLTDLARRSAKSQQETANLTKEQVSVGLVSLVDSSKAQAQAASTQADVPSYEATYATSVTRLGVLLGESPLALDGVLRTSKPIPVPPRRTAIGIPADVLNIRPDVRSAERQLAQATAKIGAAEADRYPSLKLSGSIDTSASSLADLAKKSTIAWSFGPSLNIPIFQGGQLKAAVDVAKAQRDQSLFTYQAAVLSALEEVQNAIVSLNRSRARAASLAVSVIGYRQAAKYSRELFAAGSSDLFDVLDADRSLYSQRLKQIEANADIATNFIALNKALGAGWNGAIDIRGPTPENGVEGPHLSPRLP
jgi:multidrug efflux system outer membrane protein